MVRLRRPLIVLVIAYLPVIALIVDYGRRWNP
jgi:hypothetical protein